VTGVMHSWVEHFNTGDIERFSSLFTEDIVLHRPDGISLDGKPGRRLVWRLVRQDRSHGLDRCGGGAGAEPGRRG
jgi:ketosteroid isomerase-like protein